MSDFDPLIKPIPFVFVVDPQPDKSIVGLQLLIAVGESEFAGPIHGSDPFPTTIFNRFPLPPLFYMFGNYGDFAFGTVIQEYQFNREHAGCLFAIDWQALGDPDYVDRLMTYHEELHQAWVGVDYIMTLCNADDFAQDSPQFRQQFDIPPDIPIVEFDGTSIGAGQVFQAYFQHQTYFSTEVIQPLLDALDAMAHKK